MPRHEEQATLPYGAEELFAVVANMQDYPLFVPWCSGARILREDQQGHCHGNWAWRTRPVWGRMAG